MTLFCSFYVFISLIYAVISSITIQREITKGGFHRDIETKLDLSQKFMTDCGNSSLLLFETLPAGVYADPFQLESQERFGGPKVHIAQSVNIEAAEFVSQPLELYIFVNIPSGSHEDLKDVVETKVVLPIHARYHQVATDPDVTHVPLMILHPGLYTNCSMKDVSNTHTLSAPCSVRSSDICTWYHLPYQSRASHLMLKVPVGQARHKPLVVIGTVLVSVIVSSVLVKMILSRQEKDSNKLS